MRALGLDVSLRRGLDAVLLDGDRRVLETVSRLPAAGVADVARRLDADMVAVDSPAGWARRGRSRLAERRLAAMGIGVYATPSDPGGHPFYAWMAAGFAVYAALADHFPLYRGGDIAGRAAEVFPHASAAVLAGRLPGGEAKLDFRRSVLRAAGVDCSPLRTQDLVDAALAALTGILAMEGEATAIGDPDDGLLLLPVRELPARLRPTARDDAAARGSDTLGTGAPR